MHWLPMLLVLAAFATAVHAQATAQSNVAPDLRECYTDVNLLDRNNLPPTTMPVLIDIIRKIEDNPNVNLDLRMLATQLLHTYRQDGIEYHQRNNLAASSALVLPYAPTFHSFHRHRLLLRIIPSNLQTLANDTLPSTLKCALHNILSTTVDARVRGDENNCGRLSQYRAMRTARSTRSRHPSGRRRSISDDVEILTNESDAEKYGDMGQFNYESDVEMSARQLLGESTCPILSGVVNTRWGAVSVGNLIAGIAAGAENQRVPLLELTKGTQLNYQNVQSTITTIYPATLSGDLAEAVLIQGTRGSSSISVGSAGNWNSSQATRHFMLTSRTDVEFTDPEIRGGLDGFYLGTALPATLSTFSSLRLSQLLDMYYSPTNGVFNPALRACNRRELRQTISTTNLAAETTAFTAALDTSMPLQGTLIGGLDGLVTSAVTNFMTYTGNNLNDLNCDISATTRSDSRLRTNLYVVLDATWPYQAVYRALSYLLDSIEVGKFGSSITLLSALDGSILINTTFSLADFHTAYTQQAHQSFMTGVNLATTYSNIRSFFGERLRNESATNYVGGNSTVLLFLLNSGIDTNINVQEQARLINDTVPDLRVLYATASNQFDNLWTLVRDMYNDIFTISLNNDGSNIELTLRPLLDSIQNVGRRIINPICNSEFVNTLSGSRTLIERVEPGYVNYYRLSANYFYESLESRRVRVSRNGAAIGNLVICYSRFAARPRQNNTITVNDQNVVTCETLGTSGNVEISLQYACSDYSTIGSCPPLYLSVEAPAATATLTASCTDLNQCRFPYEVGYQIQIEDLGCFSGAINVAASATFLIIGLLINIYRSF